MAAYTYFFDEVYLNTESSTVSGSGVYLMQYNRNLWSVMESILSLMQKLIDQTKTDTVQVELLPMIYHIFIPFIQHFYSKAFVINNSTQEQLTLSNKLCDAIYLLR